MPFDAFSRGVLRCSRINRRDAKRFPQLANQVRCSSGFTVVPGGVMRALPPLQARSASAETQQVGRRRRRVVPDLHGQLMDYLRQLARETQLLPYISELGDRFARNSCYMAELFDTLEHKGWIVQWHGTKQNWCGERVVRIVDTGDVLRTKRAPAHIQV
jgi:hypothetical protein